MGCVMTWAWQAFHPPGDVRLVLLAIAAAWLALALAWLVRRGQSRWTVLGWAMVFRLILFLAPPLFEDDHYRYLWDGWVLSEQGNPYAEAPSSYFSRFEQVPESMQVVLDGVNYPDVPTIYPPVCQYAFALAAWIAPGALWPWKLILLLADFAILIMLLYRGNRQQLLLYAWCPLVLFESVLNAHTDLIGIAAVFGAVLLWRRQQCGLAGAVGALAIGARWLAGLPLFFLFTRRVSSRFLICGAAAGALAYLPFLIANQGIGLEGMRLMGREWTFNPVGYPALAGWFGDALARRIGLGLFVTITLLCWVAVQRRSITMPAGVQLAWAAFFLVSPVLNAWYALWLFPFVLWRPTFTAFATMGALSLSLLTGLNLGDPDLALHQLAPWVLPLEVTLVAAGLITDLAMRYGKPQKAMAR